MISKTDFTELYDQYYDPLFRFVFLRVNDVLVTEDLLSKIFFKVLKNRNAFDSKKGKISTWLYSIASHTIIDYYRSNKENETLNDYEGMYGELPDFGGEIDFENHLKQALTALKKLPSKTQEIITLRIYETLSFHEIAIIVGIGESGVKMSFARGIEILKQSIHLIVFFSFILK